ncbi:MAG: hypothetical protein V7K27_30820 [Nostoc sp.]|uniref:hypothetical protein n=1 Tax=Nostoc sp. TaxID=1180 RepID=UPI002FFA3292
MSRRRLGGAERNPTDYQDVGLRKASTQPTIFLQHFSQLAKDSALNAQSRHKQMGYMEIQGKINI